MKEQLAKLIEMYASARGTNNADLTQLAASKLNEFLTAVEIVALPPAPEPDTELEE